MGENDVNAASTLSSSIVSEINENDHVINPSFEADCSTQKIEQEEITGRTISLVVAAGILCVPTTPSDELLTFSEQGSFRTVIEQKEEIDTEIPLDNDVQPKIISGGEPEE